MQSKHPEDEGTLQALLFDYVDHRQPRLLHILELLETGERLNDLDLEFLTESVSRWNTLRPLIERHPEHQQLVAKNIQLIATISEKALSNEPKK